MANVDTTRLWSAVTEIESLVESLKDDIEELDEEGVECDCESADDEPADYDLDSYEHSVVIKHIESVIASNDNGLEKRGFEKLLAYLVEKR